MGPDERIVDTLETDGGVMRLLGAVPAAVACVATLARPSLAQEAPADPPAPRVLPSNAPHFVKSVEVPGLNLRFLDFKFDDEAFATLERGGTHPVGRRPWVLARLLSRTAPFYCEGKTVPVGPSILILHPSRDGGGPTLELRYIDMREVFVDLNVIAEPPPGKAYCTLPAEFHKVDAWVPRLEVTLVEGRPGADAPKGTIEIVNHFGDREARVTLVRR
jgi:hypothetical protein